MRLQEERIVQYHRVVAWDRLAATCEEHLRKSRRDHAEARWVTRRFDKDGDESCDGSRPRRHDSVGREAERRRSGGNVVRMCLIC